MSKYHHFNFVVYGLSNEQVEKLLDIMVLLVEAMGGKRAELGGGYSVKDDKDAQGDTDGDDQ